MTELARQQKAEDAVTSQRYAEDLERALENYLNIHRYCSRTSDFELGSTVIALLPVHKLSFNLCVASGEEIRFSNHLIKSNTHLSYTRLG